MDQVNKIHRLNKMVHTIQEYPMYFTIIHSLTSEIANQMQEGATLKNSIFLNELIYIISLCNEYIKSLENRLYEKILFELELSLVKETVRLEKEAS